MKSHSVVFVSTLFLLFSCNFFNSDDTGTLVLKVSLTITAPRSESLPALIPGESAHTMYCRNMKFNVYEIYISEELADTGSSDLFQ